MKKDGDATNVRSCENCNRKNVECQILKVNIIFPEDFKGDIEKIRKLFYLKLKKMILLKTGQNCKNWRTKDVGCKNN